MITLPIEFWWLGLASYGASHLFHVLLWRRGPVSRDLLRLLVLFFAVPGLSYGLVSLMLPEPSRWVIPAWLHAAISTSYIAIYPAFQASSPTIRILCLLSARPEGFPLEEILRFGAFETHLSERRAELLRSGLIRKSSMGPALTLPGRLVANFFLGYRRLLGMPRGEG